MKKWINVWLIIFVIFTCSYIFTSYKNNNILLSQSPKIIYKTKIVYVNSKMTLKDKSDLNTLRELAKEVELLGNSQYTECNYEYTVRDYENKDFHENYLIDIQYVKFLINNAKNYNKDLKLSGYN